MLKKWFLCASLVVCFILSLQVSTYAVTTDRLSGSDRYTTAVKISMKGWLNSDTVVLATGENFPDALCAAPLAKIFNAPILLTQMNTLNKDTENEIARLGVKKVFIIGGQGVISDSVMNDIKSKNIECVRLSGNNRFDTAIEVAKCISDYSTVTNLAVTTGDDFADALSISPIAAQKGMPIILVPKDNLPESVKSYISSKEITKTYIMGGNDIISDTVAKEFPAFERIEGNDKYLRNIAVLHKFSGDIKLDKIYMATGDNYPDALAGSELASVTSSPIILINNASQQDTQSLIKTNLSELLPNIKEVMILGGEAAVPSSILQTLLSGNVNTVATTSTTEKQPLNSDSWSEKNNRPGGNESISVTFPSTVKGFGTIGLSSNDINKAVTIKDMIYMINNDGTVLQYNASSDTWNEIDKIAGLNETNGLFRLVTTKDKIYIIGANLSDIWEYDPFTKECTLKTKLPTQRVVGAAIAIDDSIYILAGSEKGDPATLNTLDMYDLSKNTWVKKKDMFEGASDLNVTYLNGKIYILGAVTESGGQNFEEYDIQKDQWTKKSPSSTEWFGSGMEAVNGKIYVIPSYYNYDGATDNVKEYDPDNDKWINRTEMYGVVDGYATTVCNGEIYVINCTSVEKYTPPSK